MYRSYKVDLIYEFLDQLKVKNKLDAIDLVSSRLASIKEEVNELKQYGFNDNFQRHYRFFEHLKGLLYFLENERKPDYINEKIFSKFRWIAEKLISLNEWDNKVLEQFEAI